MKTKFKHRINRIAVYLAIISFGIGTLLLLSFKISHYSGLIQMGFTYVIYAFAINSVMLLLIVIRTIRYIKDLKEHLITIGIMLLNIPIAQVYLDIAL